MQRLNILSTAALLLTVVDPALPSIIGSNVTGTLNLNYHPANFFDPLNDGVPSGFQNSSGCGSPSCTVTISSTTPTFGFEGPMMEVNADFSSGNQLVVFLGEVLVFEGTAGNAQEFSMTCTDTAFCMTFTDTAFASVSLVSSEFGALSYSFSGHTITLEPGGPAYPRFGATAIFDINVPEPSTWVKFLASFAAFGLWLCARRLKMHQRARQQ